MPRQVGARNYKNDVLISIISEILPNGEYGWEAVAIAYQEQSREECKHDTDDLKRHWIRNLCKGMKKPTGQPGAANDRVLRCIAIEQKILEKTHSGLLGIPDSNAEEKVMRRRVGGMLVMRLLGVYPPRVRQKRVGISTFVLSLRLLGPNRHSSRSGAG
jgi:hypothetical protein